MKYLTQAELNALIGFNRLEWTPGGGDPTVDYLACRGVLERDGNTFGVIDRAKYPANAQRLHVRRAEAHTYRLTRRGERLVRLSRNEIARRAMTQEDAA